MENYLKGIENYFKLMGGSSYQESTVLYSVKILTFRSIAAIFY